MLGSEAVIADLRHAVVEGVADALPVEIVVEISEIVLRLETEQVVHAKGAHELIVPGKRDVDLPGRERNVQEKADLRLDPKLAELLGHRDQVVVVDPDEVVVAHIGKELLREQPVDLTIGVVPVAIEGGEIQAVMKQRPERAIGEAAVIEIEILLVEIEGDVGDVAAAEHLRQRRRLLRRFPAPAEPDAAGFAKGRQ